MVVQRFSVPNNSVISITTISRYAGSGNEATVLYSYPNANNLGFQVWGRAVIDDPWTLMAQGTGPSGFLTFTLTPYIGFTLATPDATDPVDVTFFETAQCCC